MFKSEIWIWWIRENLGFHYLKKVVNKSHFVFSKWTKLLQGKWHCQAYKNWWESWTPLPIPTQSSIYNKSRIKIKRIHFSYFYKIIYRYKNWSVSYHKVVTLGKDWMFLVSGCIHIFSLVSQGTIRRLFSNPLLWTIGLSGSTIHTPSTTNFNCRKHECIHISKNYSIICSYEEKKPRNLATS